MELVILLILRRLVPALELLREDLEKAVSGQFENIKKE